MSKALIGTVRTAAATAAFAGVHSLLASRGAKQWFAGRFGQKAYDGTYRATYNAVAVGTSAALVGYMAAQPAREVYRVRGAAAGAMRIGQAACAAGLAAAVWGAGPLRFSGITHLRRWLTGRAVAPAPEGEPWADARGAIPADGHLPLVPAPGELLRGAAHLAQPADDHETARVQPGLVGVLLRRVATHRSADAAGGRDRVRELQEAGAVVRAGDGGRGYACAGAERADADA